jgi:hypothetical protein
MEKKEFDELVEKIGSEAATKIQKQIDDATKKINDAAVEANKGMMTVADFDAFKQEQLAKVNEQLATIEKLEGVIKDQGTKINQVLEKAAPNSKTFEQWMVEQAPLINELRTSGKFIEIPASALKAAGVTSISGSITDMTSPPGSPYAPGIGGPDLEIFNIQRNPNFILNQVDMGRTDRARLAWANETSEQGLPAEVAEGAAKPQIQNIFQVEVSQAKKIAAYYEITEEFNDDLPNFATNIRRLLQERVLRGWDDAIQAAVIAVASAYSAPALNGSIPFANFWDAIYAMLAQIRVANYIPNTVDIHPYTNVKMQGDKTRDGIYLLPSFKDEIQSMLLQGNKISVDNALVGDLKQYKVDVYKEFVIKMGWINDNFITNKFCVLGEIRYHRYISDARKTAIVNGNLSNIRGLLDGGSGS